MPLESIIVRTFLEIEGDISFKGTQALQTVWDAESSICYNALRGLKYGIKYDSNGTIIDAFASFSLANISGSKKNEVLRQDFAVVFTPENNHVEQNYLRNNLVQRKLSGNPGYLFGAQALGAKYPTRNETVGYVDAQISGLTVMNTGIGGHCDYVSTSGSTVKFGEDLSVGCTKEFTKAELEEFCTFSGSQYFTMQKVGTHTLFIPHWLVSEQDFVGIFGNADPLDRSQWLLIDFVLGSSDEIVKSPTWHNVDGRCEGIPTNLHYQFLWTYVGGVGSPQAKIIA